MWFGYIVLGFCVLFLMDGSYDVGLLVNLFLVKIDKKLIIFLELNVLEGGLMRFWVYVDEDGNGSLGVDDIFFEGVWFLIDGC